MSLLNAAAWAQMPCCLRTQSVLVSVVARTARAVVPRAADASAPAAAGLAGVSAAVATDLLQKCSPCQRCGQVLMVFSPTRPQRTEV